MESKHERDITEIFDIGIVLKLILSLGELAGGLALLIVPRMWFVRIAAFATQGELANDPNDPVASWIRSEAHTYAVHAHYFISIYLILRGTVKAVISAMILRGYWYAYPLFIAMLVIFSVYETYRGISTASGILLVFAAYDFALMLLTTYVYKRHEAARHSSSG